MQVAGREWLKWAGSVSLNHGHGRRGGGGVVTEAWGSEGPRSPTGHREHQDISFK